MHIAKPAGLSWQMITKKVTVVTNIKLNLHDPLADSFKKLLRTAGQMSFPWTNKQFKNMKKHMFLLCLVLKT